MKKLLLTATFLVALFFICGCSKEDANDTLSTDDVVENNESEPSDYTPSQFIGGWSELDPGVDGNWGVKFYDDEEWGQFYRTYNGSAKWWEFKWWLESGKTLKILDHDSGVTSYYEITFIGSDTMIMNDEWGNSAVYERNY